MSVVVYMEPHKYSAGALALLVHVIFFSMLYVSFSWQMRPPQGMVVDIWDSLPAETDEQISAPTPAEKPAQLAPPKVEAEPSLPANADIDLRSKKKKLKDDTQKLEKVKAKQQAEKLAEQAERRMEEVARQTQARSQAQHKAQEAAEAAAGKVIDEYVGKIRGKIRRFIVLPPNVSPNIKAEFSVTLLPGGEVLLANLVKPSGNEFYDSAVERAILKAQPFPLPPAEKNLFNRFRDLRLTFSPAESGQ